jgi:hypothetical protein
MAEAEAETKYKTETETETEKKTKWIAVLTPAKYKSWKEVELQSAEI